MPVQFPSSYVPQSLSHALHSQGSPLCSGPISLLAVHHAESPGMSCRAVLQRQWQPTTPHIPAQGLRLASPESLCSVKPEVVSSQCPYQKAIVFSCFVATQSPQNINWVGGSVSGREVSQEISHHKEHEPKLNLNICFLCNALQKAWHCLFSKSVPSNPGKTKQNHRCLK